MKTSELSNNVFAQVYAMATKFVESLESTVEFARKRQCTQEEIDYHIARALKEIEYSLQLIREGDAQ